MKRQIRVEHQQKRESHAVQHEETSQNVREFSTPDEMLRHDAMHTPVPPTLTTRVKESIGETPPAKPQWWKKLFGRDK